MKKERINFFVAIAVMTLGLLSFVSAQNSWTSVEFTTGSFTCNSTATTAEWINSSSGIRIQVTDSVANCNTYSHESVPSCCPINFHCNSTTGKCIDGSRITDCTKYKNQADCNADDMHVGLASVSNSSNCGLSSYFDIAGTACVNQTKCGCVWNGSSATVGICSAKKRYTIECPSETKVLGNCTWSVFSSINPDCANVNLPITISSSASWVGPAPQPADCSDISRTYPCVSVEKLPFFTPISFILSLTAIALIYCILIKKR
jgi:hypothetical protein